MISIETFFALLYQAKAGRMQTSWVFYDLYISTLRVIAITIGRIASPENAMILQVPVRSHTEHLKSSQIKATTWHTTVNRIFPGKSNVSQHFQNMFLSILFQYQKNT